MLYEVRTILFPLIIADVKEFREESVQLLLTVGKKKKKKKQQNSVSILIFLFCFMEPMISSAIKLLRDAPLHSIDRGEAWHREHRKNLPLALHWQDQPLLGVSSALLLTS